MEMCGVRACKIHRGRAVKQRRGRLLGQKATPLERYSYKYRHRAHTHLSHPTSFSKHPDGRRLPDRLSLSLLPCRESLLLRSMRSARVDSALSCKFNAKIRAARDFSNATCPTIARARRTLHASLSISSSRYHHRDVD